MSELSHQSPETTADPATVAWLQNWLGRVDASVWEGRPEMQAYVLLASLEQLARWEHGIAQIRQDLTAQAAELGLEMPRIATVPE